ncbi:MAG: P1 family peptidase [Leptolinea sp.]|nr:P1 family peptidase [Leptolinea sp.]
MHNLLTDIEGIKVGHAQNEVALTGCTVVLIEKGAVGGVDQRGGAPGTRETDLLRPMHMVDKVNGIVLTGGSAFGLDAASGVMKYLEEQGIGFNSGVGKVPIVPAAVLFDLGIGDPFIRPDANMGYLACQLATDGEFPRGNVGAGTGASVGKVFGMKQGMKSGIGSASMEIGGGVIVSALVAVNAFGDVVNPETRQIIAGARPVQAGPVNLGGKGQFADTLEVMKSLAGRTIMTFAAAPSNTVIGIVATNANFNKEETNKLAQMSHNGLALTIRPAHTMFDGDTIFALSTGKRRGDINIVGAYAVEVMAMAVLDAVQSAASAGGLPGLKSG